MTATGSSGRALAHTAAAFALTVFVALGAAAVLLGQRPDAPPSGLAFRFLGPRIGNRVASVAGIPGDPFVYYAGAASGGVWKTVDAGLHWLPVSDAMPVAAIGALAVAPTNPATVWAGTGESWAIRDTDVIGDGVYRSTDAGKTWVHAGLDETGRIARIIVHPSNADRVFVCATGRLTGPQQEKGVFRTTDGGRHWDRVLFADERTGCSGLAIDARNPRVLFAGMWQVEMHPWAELSGGPSSGIYVSRDGGDIWRRLDGRGLPHAPLGKIDVAVAPSDSNRVYALIQTADQGSLWRSDDGGDTWRLTNRQRGLIGRAGYYVRLAVSPANADEVFVANSSFWQSTDGGETFAEREWGGDNHDIWIDPKDGDRFVITHDGGLSITRQHGRSIQRVALPIGQMYHVSVDDQLPYRVHANMQDDSTMRGPVTRPEGSGRGFNDDGFQWEHGLGGCESGFTVPDPADPDIVWATCYGNKVTRYDARIGRARSVAPWMITLDSPPNESKYRCHWTAPLAVDPFDHNTVYYGCQVIFASKDAGQSWKVISPDLSTQDPARLVSSGGIVADNLGQFAGEVVFAIAPSELQRGLIWAGSNDGKLWSTRDGGAHWSDLTANIAGMPAWGAVTKIEPSHFDAGTAYVAVDAHLMDVRDPFIFKTSDFGKSWSRVNGDLPARHPLSYVRAIAEDPYRKGLLFAGTGHGFFYSVDDGAHWTELAAGLPHAPVTWIAVQKRFHDVVVSTYGRGLYVLDDVTPLEQGAAPAAGPPTLFAPRATYRWVSGNRSALITYSLPSAPKEMPRLEILDAAGAIVRTIARVPREAGMARIAWNLRYDPPRLAELRTTPESNPLIWSEPRFRGKDTRPITHWGLSPAEVGPLVAPGRYTVRLTVDGRTLTQSLDVVKDPKLPSSDEDLQASTKLQLRIRDDLSRTSDMINRIEIIRRQVEDLRKGAAGKTESAGAIKAAEELDARARAVEELLAEPAQMNSDDKYFSQSFRVYVNLLWLNGEVGPGAGDVAGGQDFAPTDTSVAVLETIEQDLAAAEAQYKKFLASDLPAFNRAVSGTGVAPIPN